MTRQQHNAARRGRQAEYLAAAWLLGHDVWVSIMPDAASTDLMVQRRDFPQRRLSIQVKAVYHKTERGRTFRTVNTSRSDGSVYDSGLVDYVLAVDLDTLTFWLLPAKLGKTRLRLTGKYSGYAYGWGDRSSVFGGWSNAGV